MISSSFVHVAGLQCRHCSGHLDVLNLKVRVERAPGGWLMECRIESNEPTWVGTMNQNGSGTDVQMAEGELL
jgi:hypothetical protein